MADNTVLNPGSGGDSIRDLNRQSLGVKTQTVALDLGGPSTNAEILITAGQQQMAASVPVVIASDQPDTAQTVLNTQMSMKLLDWQNQQQPNQFYPLEIPFFLVGI